MYSHIIIILFDDCGEGHYSQMSEEEASVKSVCKYLMNSELSKLLKICNVTLYRTLT